MQARRTRAYICTGNIHLTLQRLIINSTENGGRYRLPTPQCRQPQADDRAVHVATFTAAVYSIGSFIRDVLLIWSRNLARDPDSPQVVIFLTEIIDAMMGF